MAIQTENVNINGADFIRTYSDAGRFVVREGIAYQEAIDPADIVPQRIYTEGDLIPTDDATDEDYAQAGRILLGVSE